MKWKWSLGGCSIVKPHGCDVLPNKCTTKFTVGVKIPKPKVKRYTHVALLSSHTLFDIGICRHLIVLDKSKWSVRILSHPQLNSLLWWHHNIDLWCHNGACHHARSKHYEYFSLKRLYANCLCTLIKDSYLFVVLYSWLNNMKLNRLILLKLWYIS